MGAIIKLQLGRISKRVRENHGAEFVYGDDIITTVQARCTEAESGGRAIDNILTNSMLPQMSAEVLSRMADGEPFSKIEVQVDDSGSFKFLVS
jgi:type VI secretion system protein VasG